MESGGACFRVRREVCRKGAGGARTEGGRERGR